MQKSEVRQKQEQVLFFFFLRLRLEVIQGDCIFTLLSWNISVVNRIMISSTWASKVNSHKGLLCLGWGCRRREAMLLCCSSPVHYYCISRIFGRKLTCICYCYPPRLFSAQSFHKSSNINQKRRLHIKCSTKGDGQSPAELRYTGYYKAGRKLQAQIIRKTINDFD